MERRQIIGILGAAGVTAGSGSMVAGAVNHMSALFIVGIVGAVCGVTALVGLFVSAPKKSPAKQPPARWGP